MNGEILVAADGTAFITIDTEEYRRLVENNAYLNVILAFARDPKNYILSDVSCVVDDLIKKNMVVINGEERPQGETPTEEGRTEEAAHAE